MINKGILHHEIRRISPSSTATSTRSLLPQDSKSSRRVWRATLKRRGFHMLSQADFTEGLLIKYTDNPRVPYIATVNNWHSQGCCGSLMHASLVGDLHLWSHRSQRRRAPENKTPIPLWRLASIIGRDMRLLKVPRLHHQGEFAIKRAESCVRYVA